MLLAASLRPPLNNMNHEDSRLASLLRSSRPAPGLPPRFQQNVWRRVEAAAAPAGTESWLDALAVLMLKPRLAFAVLTVLMVTGGLLGLHTGNQTLRHVAEVRYLVEVAPNSAH